MGEIGDDVVLEFYRWQGKFNSVKLNALNCSHYNILNRKIAELQVFMSNQHGYDSSC